MPKIIALIGEKFSGKDVAANYLEKQYGATHVRFSHVLDDILKTLDLPISRRNEIDLGLGLRKIFGDGVLGHAIEQRVKNAKTGLVAVNGVRMDEMENVKKLGATTVYITAPVGIRFGRYQRRHEKTDDATMDLEHFIKQEKEEFTEKGIPKLGMECDYKIENAGSLEELYKKIDNLMN
jgi:dephospho-CoA kinase